MACGKVTKLALIHLSTDTTLNNFEPMTDWMPAIGIDAVKVTEKLRATSGNVRAQLALQTAAVRTDAADAWSRAAAADDYQPS